MSVGRAFKIRVSRLQPVKRGSTFRRVRGSGLCVDIGLALADEVDRLLVELLEVVRDARDFSAPLLNRCLSPYRSCVSCLLEVNRERQIREGRTPTGFERAIATYDMTIEGRDEWLAATGLRA